MQVTKTFEFDNQPSNIAGFIRKLLDDLTVLLLPYHHESDLLFKVKIILSELLNNAVKHSGTQYSAIDVNLGNGLLVITKKDTGKPFGLPQNSADEGSQTTICADALHVLYAVKQNQNKWCFFCEAILSENIEINHLSEHMGLLIITKAAKEFTYQYQPPYNIFSVTLALS